MSDTLKDLEYKLKQQEIELTNTKLRIKELEMKKVNTYEECPNYGHVYILKCDGGYKIGKTKDSVIKRIKGLQTANVNDIIIIMDCLTCNEDLLEKIVHFILDKYRCSNREFFDCDVEYMKLVVEFVNNNLNTMKSSFDTISKEDLYKKYINNIESTIKEKYNINDIVLNSTREIINKYKNENKKLEMKEEKSYEECLNYDHDIHIERIINIIEKEKKIHFTNCLRFPNLFHDNNLNNLFINLLKNIKNYDEDMDLYNILFIIRYLYIIDKYSHIEYDFNQKYKYIIDIISTINDNNCNDNINIKTNDILLKLNNNDIKKKIKELWNRDYVVRDYHNIQSGND